MHTEDSQPNEVRLSSKGKPVAPTIRPTSAPWKRPTFSPHYSRPSSSNKQPHRNTFVVESTPGASDSHALAERNSRDDNDAVQFKKRRLSRLHKPVPLHSVPSTRQAQTLETRKSKTDVFQVVLRLPRECQTGHHNSKAARREWIRLESARVEARNRCKVTNLRWFDDQVSLSCRRNSLVVAADAISEGKTH
jgi:hypothetical protein